MDYLPIIQEPIQEELACFVNMFNDSLTHSDGLLNHALNHILSRGGKRMRPILVLLTAKNFGTINQSTFNAAIGVELLHTASLVHDDVVDESRERRGQSSVNEIYNNKVAVLVGDYLLSTSLLHVSKTHQQKIFQLVAELGRTLSSGEILQLTNHQDSGLSEDIYYQVINQKTASLFEKCSAVGAISVGASEENVNASAEFGNKIGMIFQIRDDIFDYYDSKAIGKPTGNDMAEGKLTLPIIYALRKSNDSSMKSLAKKVKEGTINTDEIEVLVDFAKSNGGIEYAEQIMNSMAAEAKVFIESFIKPELRRAFNSYLDYVIQRSN